MVSGRADSARVVVVLRFFFSQSQNRNKEKKAVQKFSTDLQWSKEHLAWNHKEEKEKQIIKRVSTYIKKDAAYNIERACIIVLHFSS